MMARVFVIGCAGILTVSATVGAADDEFKRAIDARRNRNWPGVIANMRAALNLNGPESSRIVIWRGRLGQEKRAPYLPHYFLGEAFFHRGDCINALAHWEQSEKAGFIRAHEELVAFMGKAAHECASQGVLPSHEFNLNSESARGAYSHARVLAEKVSSLIDGNPDVVRQDMRDQYRRALDGVVSSEGSWKRARETRRLVDFEKSRRAAEEAVGALTRVESELARATATRSRVERDATEIEQIIADAEATNRSVTQRLEAQMSQGLQPLHLTALNQLTAARNVLVVVRRERNEAQLHEARALAEAASKHLKDILSQLQERARARFTVDLDAAVRGIQADLSSLDTSLVSLDARLERKTLDKTRAAAQYDSLRHKEQELRSLFGSARARKDLIAVKRLAGRIRDLRTATDEFVKSLEPVAVRERRMTDGLKRAYELFTIGRYDETVLAIESLDGLADSPLELQAYAVGAAARHALWVYSSSPAPRLREAAVADVLRIKRLNSKFLPDSRIFSPRFISFFLQTGQTPPANGRSP
jgi:hypothetical protein